MASLLVTMFLWNGSSVASSLLLLVNEAVRLKTSLQGLIRRLLEKSSVTGRMKLPISDYTDGDFTAEDSFRGGGG